MNTPIAPSPTAPLGARLVFGPEGFVYDRVNYPYAQVRHVEFTQYTETLSGQDGKERVRYTSRFRVKTMRPGKRGKWLVIRLIRPIFDEQKTFEKGAHDAVLTAMERMYARTFDARMDAYMRGFDTRKYVEWGNFQICANGDLFRRFAFCMNLRDAGVNCLMFVGKLVCVHKPKLWWKRVLWSMVKATETIDLRRDRDCFLYFMRRHVGLWWGTDKLRLWRGKAADGSTDIPRARPAPNREAPREERRAPPPPEPKPMASSVQHLTTLGLKPDANWELVRTTYRMLARKNHPDLMRGRGAGVVDIRMAEERLKAINEAYGWLEDFYRLKPKGRG